MRFRLKEPVEFSKNSFRHAKTPYRLVLRFYGWRLLIVSLIWFIYDVSNNALNCKSAHGSDTDIHATTVVPYLRFWYLFFYYSGKYLPRGTGFVSC